MLLTASLYAAVLKKCVIPELLKRNALNNIIWMHDGGSVHIGKSVRSDLEHHFGDRINTRHFPFPWNLLSPDLTLVD